MLELIEGFSTEAGQPYNKHYYKGFWESLEEDGVGQFFGSFDADDKLIGVLAAMLVDDCFNGDTIANEHFWYVDPEHRRGSHGIKLFKKFIAWSEEVGAKRISMVHLASLNAEKLGKLYERMDFVPLEIHYIKKVVA